MKITSLSLFLLQSSKGSHVWTSCLLKTRTLKSSLDLLVLAAHDGAEIPEGFQNQIQKVAQQLWGDELTSVQNIYDPIIQPNEGEAAFPTEEPFSDRLQFFLEQANQGEVRAQHSSGLLLWSGFCGPQDAIKSAKWHAAAACQGHLDSMAVLGGCLRKGVGVKRNVALGIDLIHYCASVGNPAGTNKKVALLEELENYKEAADLLEKCIASGRANALVYFNLGYLLVHQGETNYVDETRGEDSWRQAIKLAPDEGSEEAAYFLSRQPSQTATESIRLLQFAADLGFPEAVENILCR
jgi:TPR repeat protein